MRNWNQVRAHRARNWQFGAIRRAILRRSVPPSSLRRSPSRREAMGLADKNGDGEIDYEEFAAALDSHQQRSAIFGRTTTRAGWWATSRRRTRGRRCTSTTTCRRAGDLGALRAQGHVHPDFKPMELPHRVGAGDAAELAADIDQLKQRIATKSSCSPTRPHLRRGPLRYIGREELEHGIQHFNMTIPHEHVKQIVDQLDTDHDGKISTPSSPASSTRRRRSPSTSSAARTPSATPSRTRSSVPRPEPRRQRPPPHQPPPEMR